MTYDQQFRDKVIRINEVICQDCNHQFRAIPQNVQEQIAELQRQVERDAKENAMTEEQFNQALRRFFAPSGADRMMAIDRWFQDNLPGVDLYTWKQTSALVGLIRTELISKGVENSIDAASDHDCKDQLCDCRKAIILSLEEIL